jgi:hypothetical protein
MNLITAEVKTACFILKLAANGLQHIFKKWMEWSYFKKETVTIPAQSFNLE